MRVFIIIASLVFMGSCNRPIVDPEPKPTPIPLEHFRVGIDSAGTDTSLTFIVIGDWGLDNTILDDVATQMDSVAQYISPRFIVTTGDNFYEDGVDSVNDPFWSVYTDNFNAPSLDIPWYVTVGNHDHRGSIQAQIDYTVVDNNWTLPYNFYTKSETINQSSDSVDLIFYDSELLRSYPDSLDQMAWVDSVLAVSNNKWKLFFGHHTIYSYGYHGNGESLIPKLETRFDTSGIDAYICGHDHDLQHLERPTGTDYFVSGSAAKLRTVDIGPETLYAKSTPGFLVIRISSNLIEYFFISSAGKVLYSYSEVK